MIDGATAVRFGLLTRLVTSDELDGSVDALAQQIAERAPLSLREMKRAIARMTRAIDPEVLADLDTARIEITRSSDMREGLQSFLDRRKPFFRGFERETYRPAELPPPEE